MSFSTAVKMVLPSAAPVRVRPSALTVQVSAVPVAEDCSEAAWVALQASIRPALVSALDSARVPVKVVALVVSAPVVAPVASARPPLRPSSDSVPLKTRSLVLLFVPSS